MSVGSPRIRHRGRLLAAMGLTAATAVALSACSASVETNFDSGFSVTAAIEEIPAGDAERYDVTAVDLAAIADLAGVDRTGEPTDLLMPLTSASDNPAVFLPLPDMFVPGSTDATFETLGWNVTNVDRFVTYSALPTSFTTVAGELAPLPDTFTEVSDGVVTDIEGEDFAVDLTNVGQVLDRMGRPTRFAQDGKRITMTSSTPLAESWLGSGKTLADDPAAAAIAGTLDTYGVVSAIITQPAVFSGQTILGPDASPESAKAALEEFDALVPPAPYDLVGIGWTVVDGAPRWIATYHFLSADDAKDGAQVLRAVWEEGATLLTRDRISDFASVDDVVVKDSTVAVLLTPKSDTSSSMLYQLLMQREILFASR